MKYSCGLIRDILPLYFLDLDIHKYMPDEYLLKDFDAGKNNDYRKKMLGK